MARTGFFDSSESWAMSCALTREAKMQNLGGSFSSTLTLKGAVVVRCRHGFDVMGFFLLYSRTRGAGLYGVGDPGCHYAASITGSHLKLVGVAGSCVAQASSIA